MAYAETTTVPFERSVAEIVAMVKRAGAMQIGQMDDDAFYAIQFSLDVRMVTPPGGLVLDPFAGTGTTAAAAMAEGFQSLSIEAEENHVRDIGVRLGIDVSDLLAAKVEAFPTNHGDQMDMFA